MVSGRRATTLFPSGSSMDSLGRLLQTPSPEFLTPLLENFDAVTRIKEYIVEDQAKRSTFWRLKDDIRRLLISDNILRIQQRREPYQLTETHNKTSKNFPEIQNYEQRDCTNGMTECRNSKTGSHRSGNVIEDVLQSFVADTEPEQQLAYEDP
ncbi:hypothetical protein Tco_0270506 [Tanacetum coccineum]